MGYSGVHTPILSFPIYHGGTYVCLGLTVFGAEPFLLLSDVTAVPPPVLQRLLELPRPEVFSRDLLALLQGCTNCLFFSATTDARGVACAAPLDSEGRSFTVYAHHVVEFLLCCVPGTGVGRDRRKPPCRPFLSPGSIGLGRFAAAPSPLLRGHGLLLRAPRH